MTLNTQLSDCIKALDVGDLERARESMPTEEPYRSCALAEYALLGDHQYQKALEIFLTLTDDPSVGKIATLEIGRCLRLLGNPVKALKHIDLYLERGDLTLLERVKGMDQLAVACVLSYQWDSENPDLLKRAEDSLLEAIRMMETSKADANEPALMNNLYDHLGSFYLSTDRHAEAAAMLEKALPLPSHVDGKGGNLANLGHLYQLMGQDEKAEAALTEALSYLDKGKQTYSISVALRADFYASRSRLDEAIADYETAARLAESSREALAPENRGYFAQWFRDLYANMVRTQIRKGDIVTALDWAERSICRALADLMHVEPIRVADFERPDDLAIVMYYATGDDLVAFVITDKVTLQPLGSLPDAIAAFDHTGYPRNILPGAQGKLRRPFVLTVLADQIVKPLLPLVEGYIRLCVIPFSALHNAPLLCLFAHPRAFCAPSLTVLAYKVHDQETTDQVLAFGYNGRNLSVAESEALTVGQVVYTGADATVARVKAQAPKFRYLHFSTHGFFDNDDPGSSYIELADGRLSAADVEQLNLRADLVVLSCCDSGRSKVLRGGDPLGMVAAFLGAGVRSVLVALWPVDEIATYLLMGRFYQELREGSPKETALNHAQAWLRSLPKQELPAQLARPGIAKSAGKEIVALSDDPERPFSHPYWWAAFIVVGG